MRTSGYDWLLWFIYELSHGPPCMDMQQMVTQWYNQPTRSHAMVFMSLEGSQRLAGRHASDFIQSLLRNPRCSVDWSMVNRARKPTDQTHIATHVRSTLSPSEAQQPHCRPCCDAQGSCRLHDLCRQLHCQQACIICVLQYDILADAAGCVAQQQARLQRGRQQRRSRSKQRGNARDGIHHISTTYYVKPARKLLLHEMQEHNEMQQSEYS